MRCNEIDPEPDPMYVRGDHWAKAICSYCRHVIVSRIVCDCGRTHDYCKKVVYQPKHPAPCREVNYDGTCGHFKEPSWWWLLFVGRRFLET